MSGTIYDPNRGADVEANVQIAEEGLYVFNREGRRLQLWRYDEIAHAFEPGAGEDTVLIHRGRPEIRLRLREGAVYDRIAENATHLRRRRIGLSPLQMWQAVPDQLQTWMVIGAGLLVLYILHRIGALF